MIPQGLVCDLMAEFGVPGAAIGVVHREASEIAGFGVTSLENPVPVDGSTLFQIGSITKTFTATAAMRLVEAQALDLDEPVRTYLPDLVMADPRVTREVTMRHLLTHTGGWEGDYFDTVGRGDDALARMVATLGCLEQLTPLGEVWSYNNAGFYIAGRVIEVITGIAFEDALRKLVLSPLGLERSFFFADEVITHRFAVGHARTGAVLRGWSLGRPAAAVGGLITALTDLLRYARMLWDAGGFLSDASLAEMRRTQADTAGLMGDGVGLGWYTLERSGINFLRHGGGTNGQISELIVAPEEQFALAILTNHDDGGAVVSVVQPHVLQSELGVKAVGDNRLELSTAELREYVGSYTSRLSIVRLVLADDALVLETRLLGGFPDPDSPPPPAPPPTRLAFTGRDAIVALDPPLKGSPGQFLRSTEGPITWLRYEGRLYRPVCGDD